MKLRLPNRLKAAVIAAVTAVVYATLGTATFGAAAQAAVDPASANTGDTSQTMHVYILTGQSNAQGAVYASPASSAQLEQYKSGAIMWNSSLDKYSTSPVFAAENVTWRDVAPQLPIWGGNYSMGGEYGFASMMERLAGDENVTKANGERLEIGQLAVIKAALNGGGNQYWVKGNAAYQKMLEGMKNALQAAVDNGYQSVSIDGLMYLQGESNDATGAAATESRYKEYVANLTSDLSSWVEEQGLSDKISVAFDGNTVLGEPSRNPSSTIEKQIATATSDGHVNTDGNGIGFVYARDLAKGADNLHYTGESQLSIGARYAYALAVQQGYNVGAVRGSDSTKALDNAGAWWMEQLPATDAVVKWDVSSVAKTNTISSSLSVGGIVVEDPYQGQVNISGGTLHVGAQGIELKQGSLNVSSAFVADAPQTWKVAGGRTLNLGNAGTISNTISLINDSGSGTAHVSVNGATQNWNITGDVDLKVASAHAVTTAAGSSLGLAAVSGGELALDSLSLGANTTLSVGGAGTVGTLTVGSMTLGGDASVNMDFMGSTRYDKLTLSGMSGDGTVNFNFNVTKTGRGGSFTVVQGWNGTSFTYSGLEALEGATFAADGSGNLVLTLAGGESSAENYAKNWPATEQTVASPITGTGLYSAYGSGSNVLVNSRTSTGNLYVFALGSTAAGTVIGSESDRKDIYAEYHDVPSNWVAAVGSNGNGTRLGELYGDVSVKITGTQAYSSTAYAAVNAGTIHGDVYMELDNPNVTYDSINGTYASTIDGSNTIVIKGGTVTNKVAAGSVNGGNLIGGGTYLQIEGGTFNGEVTGGNNAGSAVIRGDVHVNISGGTFKNWVLIGGMYNGKTEGDVYLTISGGDFSALNTTKGIYAGCGSQNYTITGKSSITLQDIAEGNEFASYTGVLSGQNQAGSAAAIGTRELTFSHVTTGIEANLQNFTSLTVADESDATLYGSKQESLGGVSSVSVQEGSALSLHNDKGAIWNINSGITFNLEEGAILKKTGERWTNIGKLTGQGTYEIAGVSGYGSQVADLSEFNGTVHVAAGNSLQMTNAGSAGTTFSVDKGGTASLTAAAGAMGTLSGDGQVVFYNNSKITAGSSGTSFTFAEDWTGVVKLTNDNIVTGSHQELYLNKLGHKGSVIELENVGQGREASKYLYLANGDANAVTADIHLTGSGLTLNAGSSSGVATFEGAWTGSGNFSFTHTATQTFRFLGNMTDYAGNISLAGGQVLEFGNGDVSVNLGIAATSDTGKGTITGTGTTTAQVKINYLTDSTSSSTMTGNLALTQNGAQVLTVLGHNTYTGATNINNGSIKLEGDGTLGTGTVTMSAANSASLILDDMTLSSLNKTTNATISGQQEGSISATGIRGTEGHEITIANAAIEVTGSRYVLEYVNTSSSKFIFSSGGNTEFETNTALGSIEVDNGTTTTFAGDATISGSVNNSGVIAVNGTLTLTGNASTAKDLGSVAGAGAIVANSTNGNRVYTMSGDLKDWTGKFEQSTGSGNMTLNITGTDELKAAIVNKATTSEKCKLDVNLLHDMTVTGDMSYTSNGPLNVAVGDASHQVEAALESTITTNSLTVAKDSTATISEGSVKVTAAANGAANITLTKADGDAAASLSGTKVTTTSLSAATNGTTATVANTAVSVGNNATVAISDVTLTDSNITVADGATANLSHATVAATTGVTLNGVTVGEDVSAYVGEGASLSFINQSNAVNLASLVISEGASVTFNTDHSGKLTSSALTINGEAAINANLVLADNGTMTFTNGTVTLGCSVEFGQNTTIALGTAYHEQLQNNGMALIFTGVDSYEGLDNVSVTGDFATGHLIAEKQTDGSYNIYATPEPATATLSLLALAALAARRRRR